MDKTGAFSGPYLAGVKAVGTARSLTPRHFIATSFDAADGFTPAEEIFTHLAAEDLLWEENPPHVPDWLLEAAGIDACLDAAREAGVTVRGPRGEQRVVGEGRARGTRRRGAGGC